MIEDGSATPHLTIAILTNQCLIWHGLQKVLEDAEHFRIIFEPYHKMTQEVRLAERQPELFIIDIEPQLDAIGMIRTIRELAPKSKIVGLSGFEDGDFMKEAFASGLEGIILKVQPPEVVLAIIKGLFAPASSRMGTKQDARERRGLGDFFPKGLELESSLPTWPEALTEREREIIRLVEQGLSNKEIAEKLSISDSTVRHHMTRIFDKVGVPNRQKLLVHARHAPTPV